MRLTGIVWANGVTSQDTNQLVAGSNAENIGTVIDDVLDEVGQAVRDAQRTKVTVSGSSGSYENNAAVVYEITCDSNMKSNSGRSVLPADSTATATAYCVSESLTASTYTGVHEAYKTATKENDTSGTAKEPQVSGQDSLRASENTLYEEENAFVEAKALADMLNSPLFSSNNDAALYRRIRTAVDGHILSYVAYDLAHAALCS